MHVWHMGLSGEGLELAVEEQVEETPAGTTNLVRVEKNPRRMKGADKAPVIENHRAGVVLEIVMVELPRVAFVMIPALSLEIAVRMSANTAVIC